MLASLDKLGEMEGRAPPRKAAVHMITCTALAVPCRDAEFAVLGRSSGMLQRWDSIAHVVVGQRSFERLTGSCLAYSRDGGLLVVGFASGHLHILPLEEEGQGGRGGAQEGHVMRNTNIGLVRMAVSNTGQHIAVADEQHQVGMHTARTVCVGEGAVVVAVQGKWGPRLLGLDGS